jgi:hypothetical protein
LHDGTHDPILRAVFAQICHDEEGHLNFHIDKLQALFADWGWPRRAALRACWRALFRASCLVVMWDHRAVLTAVGVSKALFWWDCGLIFDEVAARIFNSTPKAIVIKSLSMDAPAAPV